MIIGKQIEGRMTFMGEDVHPKRTNQNFRAQEQKEHHNESSPLLHITEIDMVKDIPVEVMHASGGLQKKLNERWFKHPIRTFYRITGTNIGYLNDRINYISKKCLPNLFPRKLRPTSEHVHYKYTEYKQFILYTGKILLINLMPDKKLYENFLDYSVAMNLMNDVNKAKNAI